MLVGDLLCDRELPLDQIFTNRGRGLTLACLAWFSVWFAGWFYMANVLMN